MGQAEEQDRMDLVGFRPQDLRKTISGEYSLLTVFFIG